MSSAAAVSAPGRLPLVVFGPFAFDPNSRILRKGDAELALPPRVLGVLEVLLERAGDIVPRQEITDRVWKDAFVTDTSLAEAVSVLRQTLGDDPQSPSFIQTVHRRGYRFVAPVSVQEARGRTSAAAPEPAPAPHGPVSPSIGGQLVPWSAAALFAAVAIAAVWHLNRQADAPAIAVRFAIAPVEGTVFDARGPSLAISPDGSQLAWAACDRAGCRLYVRPLDRLDARALPGTDDARTPFFSPDGRWIGFFADGRLKKVAIAGGGPVTVAEAPEPMGGAWTSTQIVYAPAPLSGLMSVPAEGGEARPLTTPRQDAGDVRHAWPAVVPPGNVLLFTIERSPDSSAGGDLAALSLDARPAGAWRTIAAGVSAARAPSADVIVFARGIELHAVAFDPVRMAAAGEPRLMAPDVALAGDVGNFAVSDTGTLVHAAPAASETAAPRLAWLTGGAALEPGRDVPPLRGLSLSPDGTRLAGAGDDGGRADIWIADLARGTSTRLTHAGANAAPVWMPDGRTLFFAAANAGPFEIRSRGVDAAGPAVRLFQSPRHAVPSAVSPDGSTLAFVQSGEQTRSDIWLLSLAGRQARPLVAGPFDESAPAFSPDSRLIAYESAENGRWEVYVRRVAGADAVADDRRAPVSTEGGTHPMWMPDGRLLFQSRDRLMRAGIADSGGALRVGSVETVAALEGRRPIGVAPDGKVLLAPAASGSVTATVALDWLREARTLLGPPAAMMPR